MVDLLEVAEAVVEGARTGEQVEAFVSRGTRTTIRAHAGNIESLTHAGTAGIGVRVVTDGRVGFAWAGALDDDLIADALAEARDNASFAEPDEFAGLAEPDGVAEPELDLWRDDLDARPVDAKAQVALDLEHATVSRDPRVSRARNATYSDAWGESAVVSTNGVRASGRGTIAFLSVAAMADDDGEIRTGGGVSIGRSPTELSVEEAAADAVERAVELLGATKPPSRRVSLVLEPRMTATLLGIVGGMLNGERVLKGRSPFAGRVGDAIASPLLSFVDDPTDARSLGADVHDGEGLACRRNELVTSGVLEGFLHHSASARRAGTSSTASAVRGYRSTPSVGTHALAVSPGAGSLDDLIAGVADGVIVKSMKGLHSGVNPVSGDFSVGIEGLSIRNGRIAEPVAEATIAGSLQRMLADVVAVGADLEWTPGGSGGVSMVIEGISLGGS
ncbi:MAG TPA: TldD/PmbA family protein [Acidimicrobiales bacterium]|nr:TldD/PmbA family protein [Acidimicrobiales bacterium]